ncbi:hypothetical protein GCM10011416_03610 [Polaribacter pacificus]|uniref:TonB C-terminal domain-containing protein n=1 Tax=Polaribacter pacificus TaxID=1775173 RepID=A0A917HUZ6_9FLAO|nr:hypothetical protein GCM10011416_03610 [Polaribacter pacificus]
MYSQDNKDIARIYLQKAATSFEGGDFEKATNYLEKSVKYLDGIKSTDVAIFGAKLYVQKKNFLLAQKYAKQYFVLSKNKKSKEYSDMLLQYVEIKDAVDKLPKEETGGDKDTTTVKVLPQEKKVHPQFLKAKAAFKEKNYILAKVALDAYFLEVKDKTTDEYQEVLNFFVEVKDKLESPTTPTPQVKDVVKKDSIEVPTAIDPIKVKKDSTTIESETDFVIVQTAPVYPGCNGDNTAIKSCLDTSLKAFFVQNFNAGLASELGLEMGVQKITSAFMINEEGVISDIKIQAAHSSLEAEALRVLKLVPTMKPATQRGKPVSIKYSFPISFNVQ